MPINTDAYFHKTVNFRFWKQELKFRTSRQLFSSQDIDAGTKFLLRTIMEAAYPPFQRILDAGCGYGPLGLTLKSLYPDSLVHLFDRDALAVAYSQQNATLNGLSGVEIYGSLGYDDVKQNDFDFIIANIPDHAGETVITYLLQEARYYLAPGGIVAIVVVTPLEEMVDKILANTEIILKRSQSRHVVFHYRITGATPSHPVKNSLERGIYFRGGVTWEPGKLSYTLQTANSLPEFDTLNYGTLMMIDALNELRDKKTKSALILNPGQGHIAVALWKYLQPGNIALVDKDLLALRYTQRNLALNGCPPDRVGVFHQAGLDLIPGDKFDLVLGILREDESPDAHFLIVDRMAGLLADKGIILLSSGSTAITRLEEHVVSRSLLRIKGRERRRGFSLLTLEKG
jgi:16S rRNA (guanine1207-N2)-methyltransferase